MFNIGVETDKGISSEVVEAFREAGCCLELMRNDKVELYDGIVFEENAEKAINFSCLRFLQLRNDTDAFIWVLLKEPSETTSQLYLELGADGVFNQSQWLTTVLHIRNTLYRNQTVGKNKVENTNLHSNAIENHELDPFSRKIISLREQLAVELTKTEFKLVHKLMENNASVCSYEELAEHLWEEVSETSLLNLANLIFRIRSKLKEEGIEEITIKTIRSTGYQLLSK
ncbi:winged helix-turn-helix domain-containing protein [Enterococcus rivorum]|uniref:OmpR/PhoB-type domain-containing protein n=1 Tax=Enterococcus rivorum TaxID=762845 RepID=A0A1E5KXC3_9ENTE|nr:winged helix-turn-helix domain-containing protein [Enterococcus rivorum]MBP2099882.1 DNA-binding response OmpR family regulator [Enterococcus rivorum]OEH82503.1 hypothetical protein BCR26_13090 [Enterococcus rivorum]